MARLLQEVAGAGQLRPALRERCADIGTGVLRNEKASRAGGLFIVVLECGGS